MSNQQIEELIPRLSWWKDIKGRTWVITGLLFSYPDNALSQVEMIQQFDTVGTYVPIMDILKSIENKQMVRMNSYNGKAR
jgi:hypothetical protein